MGNSRVVSETKFLSVTSSVRVSILLAVVLAVTGLGAAQDGGQVAALSPKASTSNAATDATAAPQFQSRDLHYEIRAGSECTIFQVPLLRIGEALSTEQQES
jgi:hypothetical protein